MFSGYVVQQLERLAHNQLVVGAHPAVPTILEEAMQKLRSMRGLVRFLVQEKSDFWIQRTNPLDPEFSRSDVYQHVCRTLHDSNVSSYDGAIRSAFLDAMQWEKENRMKAMRWDPYGPIPPA